MHLSVMRWCVVMSVAVGLLAGVAVGVGASLTLVDQGYEDLVVGISPSLDESQAQEIIAGVKAAMNDASHALFAATKHQLYIKKVKILVPNTWTSFPVDQEATNENFEESHIRVDKEHPVYKDQVYTKHVGNCREPGLYIHLTQQYLTKTHQRWGARGKELVKAWAKLRWGVFEEGGYKDDEKYPLFYYNTKGNEPVLRPNQCNEEIKGRFIDRLTNQSCIYSSSDLPGENCRFKPDPQQTSISSLMSFTNLDHIDEFCDDNDPTTLHDSEAPNRHNDLCDGLSVWEIMSAHQDFKNVSRRKDDYPVSPELVVVKKPMATFALVLDYSSSMKGSKISVLVNTAKRWLLHDVADGSFVTIIKFEEKASLVRGLTMISDSTRQELSSAINTKLKGTTCIGCGLRRAVQEMKGRNNTVILLITDGEENRSPNITTVMDEVVNSKARVVTIAYGNSAAVKLETLAKNTGGKTFFVPDNDDGSTMDKAFQGSLTYQPGNTLKNANVKIEEGTYSFPGRSYAKRYFEVDPTVGRNLEFRLSIHPNIEGKPYLISPSGKNFTNAQFFKDSNLWIIRLGDTVAESGGWTWFKPLSKTRAKISIIITAQARDPLKFPITTQAGMNIDQDPLDATEQKVIVYGIVEQDENPVVGAKVMAYITTQNTTQKAYELELLDNGSNADQTANDGTYSRYFTQFSSLGRYSVEVQVTNGDSYINHGFITSRRRRRRSSDETEVPEYCCGSFMPFNRETATPTGKFKRFASAGSFRVEKKPDKGVDLFPPCKVRDVTVKVIGKSLELNWTAPGDDYDNGKVSGYEIWMSSNSNSLKYELKETTNTIRLLDIDSSSKMPELLKESGKKVSVHLPLKESLKANTLYFLVLRAEDHSRNKAPMSRPVSFVASGGVRVTNTLYPWILPLLLLTVMYCWC